MRFIVFEEKSQQFERRDTVDVDPSDDFVALFDVFESVEEIIADPVYHLIVAYYG